MSCPYFREGWWDSSCHAAAKPVVIRDSDHMETCCKKTPMKCPTFAAVAAQQRQEKK